MQENEKVIETSFAQRAEPQAPTQQDNQLNNAIMILYKLKKILNVSVLAFITLLGALGIFGVAIADPFPARLVGAALYAVCVLWPVMWAFFKKG